MRNMLVKDYRSFLDGGYNVHVVELHENGALELRFKSFGVRRRFRLLSLSVLRRKGKSGLGKLKINAM